MIELKFFKNDANTLKCENDALKIKNIILNITTNENIFWRMTTWFLKEKLKELSSNAKNEIAKIKTKNLLHLILYVIIA